MNRNNFAATGVGLVLLLAGSCASLWADARVNPYTAIVERNPFGLKPPPPPPDPNDNVPKPPAAPLATVELTGITSILGPPRALLEIIPGPGKPMLKPVLSEGERVESIEVVSINVVKNEVIIKNGGTTTNLTFKIAKPAQPSQPGVLPASVPKPVATQPPQNSYNNQGSGRYNVMVAGGSSPATPTAAGGQYAGGTPAYGGASPAYGGASPNAPTLGGGAADGGFRNIPSRNLRTATQAEDPAVSRLQHFEEIENSRAINYLNAQAGGRPLPPLPPTPLTPHDAPDFQTDSGGIPPFPGQRQPRQSHFPPAPGQR